MTSEIVDISGGSKGDPSPEVVSLLEEALADAKRGLIVSCGVGMVLNSGLVVTHIASNGSGPPLLLSAVSMLQWRIASAMR